jgi:copper chaperone CopZ
VFPAFLLAILLAIVPARAGVRSVVLRVGGMTCPLCVRGVEESVKRLDGVAGVEADLATGQVRVEAATGLSLSVQQIKERIVHAGFRIGGEPDLLANGRFAIGPARRIIFRVLGTPYFYRVLEGSELLRFLKAYPRAEGEFLVGFRLHDRPQWKPAAITITSFEPSAPTALQAGR